MRRLFVRVVCVVVGAVACVDETPPEPSARAGQGAFVSPSLRWPSRFIPVCWENPTPADDAQRRWVQESVEATWMNVADVDFVGWGACAADSLGIRVRIHDGRLPTPCPRSTRGDAPHVCELGNALDGVRDGMVLNFTFVNWGTAAQSAVECNIRAIGVHEFGHALGFAHEQNRADTDRTQCLDQPQGADGEVTIGPWDRFSVMNYCNPLANNGGNLSPIDVRAAREVYGHREPTRPMRNAACAAPTYRYDAALECRVTCCDESPRAVGPAQDSRACDFIAHLTCAPFGGARRVDFGGTATSEVACPRGGHNQLCTPDGRCATSIDRCEGRLCRSRCYARCRNGDLVGPHSAASDADCEGWSTGACAGRGGASRAEFNDVRVAEHPDACGRPGEACCRGFACPYGGQCDGTRCRNSCYARCRNGELRGPTEAAGVAACRRDAAMLCAGERGGALRVTFNDTYIQGGGGGCGEHRGLCCPAAPRCDQERAGCSNGLCRNFCYARCRDGTLQGPADPHDAQACRAVASFLCQERGGAVRAQFNFRYVLNHSAACGGLNEACCGSSSCDAGLRCQGAPDRTTRCVAEDETSPTPVPTCTMRGGESGECEVCCGGVRASAFTSELCCRDLTLCANGSGTRRRFRPTEQALMSPLECP